MLFSFVVPVYNAEKYLNQCLRSIKAQTYGDIEIICVDNNSTDGSRQIIESHARADSRVICLSQPKQGVSNARNAGIEVARGEYVLFIDADDFVEPTLAESVLASITSTGAEIVMFPYDQYFESNDEYRNRSLAKMDPPFAKSKELGDRLFYHTTPSACLKAFKRNLLEDHCIRFDPSIRFGEDLLFSFSCLMLSDGIYQIHGKALYHYRKEVEGSATQKRANDEGSIEIIEVLEKLDRVRAANALPLSFEMALLNQALNEANFALSVSSTSWQFDQFYSEFSKHWQNRLRSHERTEFSNPELYDLFAKPGTTLEVLYAERARLKEANAALKKQNAQLKKECTDNHRKLEQSQAKLKKTLDSRAFKIGTIILTPMRAARRLLAKASGSGSRK